MCYISSLKMVLHFQISMAGVLPVKIVWYLQIFWKGVVPRCCNQKLVASHDHTRTECPKYLQDADGVLCVFFRITSRELSDVDRKVGQTAEYSLFYRVLLQKRPILWRSVLLAFPTFLNIGRLRSNLRSGEMRHLRSPISNQTRWVSSMSRRLKMIGLFCRI